MKRVLSLALMLILLCGCTIILPGSDPTPSQTASSATPAPTPEPDALMLWLSRCEKRFNMEYRDFAEYWSLICDEVYGDSIAVILSVSELGDKEAEIESKRSEYSREYGKDWHYEIISHEQTALSDKVLSDFAAELSSVADKADIPVKASESWSDAGWEDFAEHHSCSADRARELIAACAAIRDTCRDAEVTAAFDLELSLKFTGSETEPLHRIEYDTVYEVNGSFVSQMFVDYSVALIDMIL